MQRRSTTTPVLNRNSPQARGLLVWMPGFPSGGSLFDWSQRGLHGVRETGATWATGQGGLKTAIAFNGTSRVVLPRSDRVFDVSRNAMSISLWVNTTNIARYQYLCVSWGTAAGTDSFHLRLDITAGTPYFTHSSNGNYTSGNDLLGVTNCADGKWHHIVATHDGAPGTTNLYVDGRLDATKSAIGVVVGIAFAQVCLAGLSDGNLTGNWLIGRLEDVRIYDYAVPHSLVRAMYEPATRFDLEDRRSGARDFAATVAPGSPFTRNVYVNQAANAASTY